MNTNSRLSQDNPYEHIRRKTNDDWFMYWLCEDGGFIEDCELLSKLGENGSEKFLPKLEQLLKKYGISEDEYDIISNGLHLQAALDFPLTFIQRESNGDVLLRMPRNIKKVDYLNAWDELKNILDIDQDHQSNIETRNRAADDTRLIYAIFRARRDKLRFSEIFNLYQNGNLEQYKNGPTNQFSSDDNLERYYDRYKPDR